VFKHAAERSVGGEQELLYTFGFLPEADSIHTHVYAHIFRGALLS